MEILQEIGSYAGLAAVLGLAVLSALYFSQARDVKRLREWAGRAPERAPETTGAQGVAAKPVPARARPGRATRRRPRHARDGARRAAGAAAGPRRAPREPRRRCRGRRRGHAGRRAAAAAADAGAGRGRGRADGEDGANGTDENSVLSQDTDGPPAAAAAGRGRRGRGLRRHRRSRPGVRGGRRARRRRRLGGHRRARRARPRGPTGTTTGDEPDECAPRPVTPAARARSPPGAPVPAAGTPRAAADADAGGVGERLGRRRSCPRTRTSRPGGRRCRRRQRTRASSPPGPRDRRGRRGRPGPRRPSRWAPLQLAGRRRRAGRAPAAPARERRTRPPAARTTTPARPPARRRQPAQRARRRAQRHHRPGLAAQIGDQIERQGFQLGTVTNFNDQQRAESVVLYAPGAEREAADVGRRLKIAQREPIDAESQGVAGDATVVVVRGRTRRSRRQHRAYGKRQRPPAIGLRRPRSSSARSTRLTVRPAISIVAPS